VNTSLQRAFVVVTLALSVLSGCAQHTATLPPPAPKELAVFNPNLGIANLRDFGGYSTASGAVVRRGLLYRSGQLTALSPADTEKILQLGLKTNLDLRTSEEVIVRPDKRRVGIKYYLLNVLAYTKATTPVQMTAMLEDPKKANELLGGGKAEAMMTQIYRDLVTLLSAKKSYRELFLHIGKPGQLPAIMQCATGKDQTGWGAAALLSLLGVPRETVMADFLRSNENILPSYQKDVDAFVAAGGDRSIPLAIVGVKREYLEASFDEVQKRYGSMERYFAEGMGIDAAGQKALRDLYLEKR
jgi:protein-tyrosine phosphatase